MMPKDRKRKGVAQSMKAQKSANHLSTHPIGRTMLRPRQQGFPRPRRSRSIIKAQFRQHTVPVATVGSVLHLPAIAAGVLEHQAPLGL